MLISRRRQYHQHVAHALEDRFPETAERKPELLAYHYTEAGMNKDAVGYWQRAGEWAVQHSADLEAINHLTKG